MADTVHVAIIPMHYEVIAVARTEDEAIRLAGERAIRFLREGQFGPPGENYSVEEVVDYFGVRTAKLDVGSAQLFD